MFASSCFHGKMMWFGPTIFQTHNSKIPIIIYKKKWEKILIEL